MNLKISSIIGIWAICLAAGAQQINVYYSFTISSGYTLTDAYIINTEPQEAGAFIAPLTINGQTNFPSGTYGGVLEGTTYGNNCVTIIGLFINAAATNIGVTMPPALAGALIPGGSWADYVTNVAGGLPNETNTISDLQSGSSFFLQNGYGYLPNSSPVLQAYGQLGTVVAIDGAQSAGTFSFSLTPILNISSSAGSVTLQWLTNATGFTLQSATNLVPPAVWSTNLPTPVVVNGLNTITNPISGTAQYYRLSQ